MTGAAENSVLTSEGDTIAAVATAAGRGAIGIVRVSGPLAESVSFGITGKTLIGRKATLANFQDSSGRIIDQGIAIFFPGPMSYTGESSVELHGHGNPVVLDQILWRVIELGCRLARPGEFTERAFLNGKFDLTQAEAVADLISSANARQAEMALRTIQGALKDRVRVLGSAVVEQRVRMEGSLDFPDEEIDVSKTSTMRERIAFIVDSITELLALIAKSKRLFAGLRVVIVGKPNVGKSSILNQLSKQAVAIVTDVPGTTRDLIKNEIDIDGVLVQLTDTAGLRIGSDLIEQEGIRRAKQEAENADLVLWVYDTSHIGEDMVQEALAFAKGVSLLFVQNKIDLHTDTAICELGTPERVECIPLSAATGVGFDRLTEFLRRFAVADCAKEESFVAHARHIRALRDAREYLDTASKKLHSMDGVELIAEELRLAHHALGSITGEFSSNDLLEEIFSHFCIGK